MSAYPPYSSPPAPPGSPPPWASPPPWDSPPAPPASPTPWDSPPAPPGTPPAPPGAPAWTSGAPSSEESSKTNVGGIIGAVVGVIVVIGIILGLVVFFVNRRRRIGNKASDPNPKHDPGLESMSVSDPNTKNNPALGSMGASDPHTKVDQSLGSMRASDPNTKFDPALGSMSSTPMPGGGAREYSLPEMDAATYAYKRVIGKGGFGPVYYGRLADGKEVAVKELDAASKQGFNEFFNEVDILSRVHHRHLVSLYGYCRARGKQMLVYEYIHKGALRDHLDGDTSKVGSVVLDWKTRLKIGLQAALGLEYLHTYCIPSLIQRDVKSTNILITSNNEAKVADFGLSRLVGEDDASHVMTVVKGTPGYLDPEYFQTNQLSTYSDVYSFGVVLLELITGRMPIFTSTAPNQVNTTTALTDWVRSSLMTGNDNIDTILDPKLRASRPNQDALWKVAEIALRSVEPKSMHRPTMNDVVQELQAAAALEKEPPVASSNSVHPPRAPPPRFH